MSHGLDDDRPKHIAIGIIITLSLVLDILIPSLKDFQITPRVLAIIIVVVFTEIIFEKFHFKGDFGPMSYIAAIVHPGLFPLASYTLHGALDSYPLLSDFQSLLLGNEYRAKYRGDVNFRNIQSEHSAVNSIGAVSRETIQSYCLRESIVLMTMAAVLGLMHGATGVVLSVACFVVYLVLQHQEGNHDTVRHATCEPINERRGIYAIEVVNLWTENHVGIGYLADGTFTTKYHVTNGKPIFIGSKIYEPCYYSTKADIVCYGSPPNIQDVADGDTIVVALSGPYSEVIVTYSSFASVNEEGYITFVGKKSIPGTSGSPLFKRIDRDGEIDYCFAGCIGWAVKVKGQKPNEITELAMNTGISQNSGVIDRGSIMQYIDHPGSGKTRNILPVIQQGISMYGRTFLLGPTRGVSMELLAAYEDNPIEGLIPRVLIRGVRKCRAVSGVTISTHATILKMLVNKDSTVMQPALWILDESHFTDRATQALKHYLRHLISEGIISGSLYEMTATAYNIHDKRWTYCDNSNYPITDVIMEPKQMLENLLEKEDRKAIVFVTSIRGKEKTSSANIAEILRMQKKTYVEVNRQNFLKSYPAAKSGKYNFILTTNISECGVNLDVDVCYDFQEGPKPLVRRWDDVIMRTTGITKSQYVQRRGRVGRRKPGEYIGPKTKFELPDVVADDVTHLDVALFLKEYQIEPKEPVYQLDNAANYHCTRDQINYLFAGGEDNVVNSMLTLQLVVDTNGAMRSSENVQQCTENWNRGDEINRTIDGITYNASFWDDRDKEFYVRWKALLSVDTIPKERDSLFRKISKEVFSIGKQMKYRGVWMRRSSETDDYAISGDEGEQPVIEEEATVEE